MFDDSAAVNRPRSGGCHRFEHSTVVSDENKSSFVVRKGGFKLFDGRKIKMIRRLIENEKVYAFGLKQGKDGASAFTRRQR